LWSWRTVLWLVAMLPAVAYLVVGGFPSTRGIQQAMSGPVGTGLMVAGMLAGLVVALSQVPALVKGLRGLRDPVWHEARIRPAARLAVAGTSVAGAVVLLVVLVAAGGDATRHIVNNSSHILEAATLAVLVAGLALLAISFFVFPPVVLVEVPEFLAAVLPEAALAGGESLVAAPAVVAIPIQAIGEIAGTSLAGGAVISEASGRGSSSGGGGSSSSDAAVGGGGAQTGPGEIRFGTNANQFYHVTRHLEEAGVDSRPVLDAIRKDLEEKGSDILPGLNKGTVSVDGRLFDYNAYRLPDGTINVGRITVP